MSKLNLGLEAPNWVIVKISSLMLNLKNHTWVLV